MSAFERWVLAVKRKDSPGARIAHDTYRRMLELNVPDSAGTRALYRAVGVAWDAWVDGREYVAAKLLYEPMLRARAERVGARLKLTSPPYVRGHARIVIGDDCTFSSFSVASGRFVDRPELLIGSGCHLGSAVFFSVNRKVVLEDHVGVAGQVAIQDSDGHPSDPERRMRGEQMTEADIAPVTIQEYAWIGRRAQVMKGVTVGRGAIVAGGSVVVADVPEGAIAMGVPARVVRR
jgi:carbonic anhydrase/acetyltransferase-like protein (isoleucine patch superfamily)